MKFYGNILVSVFNFFRYLKGDRGGYRVAIFYVMMSQLCLAGSILAILNRSIRFDWKNTSNDVLSGIFVFIVVAWLVLLARYYTFDKLGEMEKEFADKPDREQTLWGIIAILSIVVPALVYIFLTTPN